MLDALLSYLATPLGLLLDTRVGLVVVLLVLSYCSCTVTLSMICCAVNLRPFSKINSNYFLLLF